MSILKVYHIYWKANENDTSSTFMSTIQCVLSNCDAIKTTFRYPNTTKKQESLEFAYIIACQSLKATVYINLKVPTSS